MKKSGEIRVWMGKNTGLIILALILLSSLMVRVYRLDQPRTYYFDEVYHAFTAEAYSRNDPKGYEWWHASSEPGTAYEWLHPPISKLLMGGSIALFGHESWAWRIPSALFGTGVIWAVYWLGQKLFADRKLAIMGALIASWDGLLLTQSRIAMNDIFVVFFMLVALGFYWQWRSNGLSNGPGSLRKTKHWSLAATGVATGLAIATKWSGVFLLGVVGVWELIWLVERWIERRAGRRLPIREVWGRWWRLAVAMVFIPGVIYVLSYGQFWLQGHTWDQFVELHNQIKWYQTNLDATHPYQSKPWQWVLNLEPVWFYVDYSQEGKIGNIYALANPAVAWGGLVAVVVMMGWGIKKRQRQVWFLLTCYLMFWVPWVLSPRIMFFYHYAPAVPFLAMAVAYVMRQLDLTGKVWAKIMMLGVGIITGGLFVYFYPHWTGMLVDVDWSQQYHWISSWK